MAIKNPADLKSMFVDKKELQRKVAAANARIGFVKVPNATARRAREMMLAAGINPEDRLFSSEIIRMRYGEEE